MANSDGKADTPRQVPKLADIREALSNAEWSIELTPAFAEIAHPKVNDKITRGYYGEDQLARFVTGRGELILDYASGIEDTNKGGADLVTLAEDEHGDLIIKFYDNKAFSTSTAVSHVSALDKNLATNVDAVREALLKCAEQEGRNDAERMLFSAAAQLIDEDRLKCVVTNCNGKVDHLTARLDGTRIEFEDVAGKLATPPRKIDTSVSAFDTSNTAVQTTGGSISENLHPSPVPRSRLS